MTRKIAKLCYDGKQYFAQPVGQTQYVSNESINTVFAENLRTRMDAAGLSQLALAKKCGVAQTSIGNYLDPSRRAASAKGKEPSAKLTEMALIANALGLSPWEMLIPSSATQDAAVEQQALELATLFREMPGTARTALLEQARLLHKGTRPQEEMTQSKQQSLGGASNTLDRRKVAGSLGR